MKFFAVVALLAAQYGAASGEVAGAPERTVAACLKGPNDIMVYRGQANAVQILKTAGVRLQWRRAETDCAQGQGIVVHVSVESAPKQHVGALAYASLADSRVVVFYDRVLATAGAAVNARLLGHVLAHEIVHILQGVETHSSSGLMKPRWEGRDFSAMQRASLSLTPEDLALINRGFEWRAGRGHPAE